MKELFDQLPLIGRFAIIFALLVFLPRVAERCRLPGVLGLVVGGILLGPDLLGLLNQNSRVVELFSELGKLLLMFYAGREIDLNSFRTVGWRAVIFGLMTCLIPLGAGFLIGQLFGYSVNASILIGSLLASHTLLGLPILKQFNLTAIPSVSITVTATVMTDIISMLVLAVCVTVHQTGFSMGHLERSLLALAIYIPLVVFGISWIVRWLFQRFKLSNEARLAIKLLMVAVAAFAAEEIELEGIVGAFLTGIAVRRAIPEESEHEPLYAVSHALFIPMFFISVGLIVNTRVLWHALRFDFLLVATIVLGLVVAKFLAAYIFGQAVRFKSAERGLMWSLSLPQVAATLAATVVGVNTVNAAGVHLIDERILNAVVVLVVASAILGPLGTRYFARQLAGPDAAGASGQTVTGSGAEKSSADGKADRS